VPTLSSLWQRPGAAPAAAGRTTAPPYVVILGLAVIGIVVVAGIAVGTNERLGSRAAPAPVAAVATGVVTQVTHSAGAGSAKNPWSDS
jgi:hypothetical protein